MTITSKIIITDTNILTDLDTAKILDKFVKLDNVYISDLIKRDEINSKTGNISLINKLKVTSKKNNYILATGDNRLKIYAEKNGVVVIRTLKIIKMMAKEKIISIEKAIKACNNLLESPKVRIPSNDIKDLIKELEPNLVSS